MTTATSAVIVLRGLSREAEHAQPFLNALQHRLAEQTVVCPDLPGTGVKRHQPSPTDVPAIMRMLQAEHDLRHVHLVGISLGGMIACAWAEQHPTQVRTLTLVNSSLKRYSAIWQRLQWQRGLRILLTLANWNNVRKREAGILSLVSNDPPTAQLIEEWVAIQQRHPVQFSTVRRQMQAASTYLGPARPPCLATQVLVSDADRLVSPQCSIRLANAWQIPIKHHAEAGHDLFLDAPKWCAEHIADWIHQHA